MNMFKAVFFITMIFVNYFANAENGQAIKVCKQQIEQLSPQEKYECFIKSYEAGIDVFSKVPLLVEAASSGHIQSIYSLGLLYSKGDVLNKDVHQGNELLILSAQSGHVDSQYLLGLNYEELAWEADVDNRKNYVNNSQEWLAKATNNGHLAAKRELAASLLRHTSVEIDFDKAEQLLKESIAAGDKKSIPYIIDFYRVLYEETGEHKYEKQRLFWEDCFSSQSCQSNVQ
jgi:TPR repeat protein